jgi:hypothetical protein
MVCLDTRALAAIALVLLVNNSDAFAIAVSGSKLAAARSTLKGIYNFDHWLFVLQPQYLHWVIRFYKNHVLFGLTQCLHLAEIALNLSTVFINNNAYFHCITNAVRFQQQQVLMRQSA